MVTVSYTHLYPTMDVEQVSMAGSMPVVERFEGGADIDFRDDYEFWYGLSERLGFADKWWGPSLSLIHISALVIAVVAFATIAVGQEAPKFVLMGLCLSVALLAIAMLQDHYQHKQ